jgi:UDP-N-acetyl-D-mannosaminuronate dehydrogenase
MQYSSFDLNSRSRQTAKFLENTFRLVSFALVNEFTQIRSASGINLHEVIDAASSKPTASCHLGQGLELADTAFQLTHSI